MSKLKQFLKDGADRNAERDAARTPRQNLIRLVGGRLQVATLVAVALVALNLESWEPIPYGVALVILIGLCLP